MTISKICPLIESLIIPFLKEAITANNVLLLVFSGTVDPPIPPLSRLAKNGGKRTHIIYNQKKHIRDLKISGDIGGGNQRRCGIGGTIVQYIYLE